MKKYKLFTLALIGVIAVFVAFNAVIWHLFTGSILKIQNYTRVGDLVRIAYITELAQPRDPWVDLPKTHVSYADYLSCPIYVLVIGDSYAQGGGRGRNPYFQDHLASLKQMNVLYLDPRFLNLPSYDYITLAAILVNSGWLAQHRPKYLLLERAERQCIWDYARDIDFNMTASLSQLAPPEIKNRPPQPIPMINSGNFKFLLYKFLFNFSVNAFFSEVGITDLQSDCFDGSTRRKLVFYYIDVQRIPRATETAVHKLNHNFNVLSKKLAQHDIKLIFMPVVDKFNLYRDYVTDNRLPRSTFFEKLRPLPKDYLFVDTKLILEQALQQGVKDLFHPDDSHWTWKASHHIFEHIDLP